MITEYLTDSPEALAAIDAPGEKVVWIHGSVTYIELIDRPLAERQASRCLEVDALRDAKLQRFAFDFGAPHGVQHLQLRDADDVTSWLTLRGTATDLIVAGVGETLLPLRTEENNTLYLSAVAVSQVMGGLAAYGAAVKSRSWELKDAIRESENPEGIDITIGWVA